MDYHLNTNYVCPPLTVEHPAPGDPREQGPEEHGEMLDLVVVGAGPHGLAVAARALDRTGYYTDHELTTKRRYYKEVSAKKLNEKGQSLQLKVVDPWGCWMGRWNESFKQLQIPFLRSPAMAHIDPFDENGLLSYAVAKGSANDLKPIDNLFFEPTQSSKGYFYHKGQTPGSGSNRHQVNLQDEKLFRRPSTKVFGEFCEDVCNKYHLENSVVKAKADRIEPVWEGGVPPSKEEENEVGPVSFLVHCSNGETLHTKNVVLALGQTIQRIPQWAVQPLEQHPDRIVHTDNMKLETTPIQNKRHLIVGGGLSSGHLSVALEKEGGIVTLCHRSKFRVRHFDVGLEWVGRYQHATRVSQFWTSNDPAQRLKAWRHARGAASMAPDTYSRVQHLSTHCPDRFFVHECTNVVAASWQEEKDCWHVDFSSQHATLDSLETGEYDYIWLATGRILDMAQEPVAASLLKHKPVEMVEGFPILDLDLRWAPHWNVFVVGAYASLQIGPDGPNLMGARPGATRISPQLDHLCTECSSDNIYDCLFDA